MLMIPAAVRIPPPVMASARVPSLLSGLGSFRGCFADSSAFSLARFYAIRAPASMEARVLFSITPPQDFLAQGAAAQLICRGGED